MTRRVPLQVYVDEALYQRLREAARRRAISQSELVRRLLAEGLARQFPGGADPALQVIGLGASGLGDLAARHDDHLAESYRNGRGG